MTNAAWQALQMPDNENEGSDEPVDLEKGKFQWDGKFTANPAVTGDWTVVAVVPAIEAFDPAAKPAPFRAPFKDITFADGGETDSATMFWSGDTLIDLARLEALKMTVKDGYLFIESGGFSARNKPGWKSPLLVMKRK
jgi:hypothetical protein